MLRERRPHRRFGRRSERAFVPGCYRDAPRGIAGSLIPDRAVASRRPRAGALVEEIAAARLPLAEPERALPRAHRVRSRAAPAGRDFDDEAQEAPGRVRRVRRGRRPCRRGARRRRASPAPAVAAPLAPHSPIVSALAQRQAEHERAAPGAAQGAPGRPPRAPRLRAPRADVVAGAPAARAPRAARRHPRPAPDRRRARRRRSPARLRSIAACESGGNPRAVGGGGAFRGKYQFDYGTWAAVGGSGDPAAAPEAEQDRRAAMLYARAGLARLRPWPVCGR